MATTILNTRSGAINNKQFIAKIRQSLNNLTMLGASAVYENGVFSTFVSLLSFVRNDFCKDTISVKEFSTLIEIELRILHQNALRAVSNSSYSNMCRGYFSIIWCKFMRKIINYYDGKKTNGDRLVKNKEVVVKELDILLNVATVLLTTDNDDMFQIIAFSLYQCATSQISLQELEDYAFFDEEGNCSTFRPNTPDSFNSQTESFPHGSSGNGVEPQSGLFDGFKELLTDAFSGVIEDSVDKLDCHRIVCTLFPKLFQAIKAQVVKIITSKKFAIAGVTIIFFSIFTALYNVGIPSWIVEIFVGGICGMVAGFAVAQSKSGGLSNLLSALSTILGCAKKARGTLKSVAALLKDLKIVSDNFGAYILEILRVIVTWLHELTGFSVFELRKDVLDEWHEKCAKYKKEYDNRRVVHSIKNKDALEVLVDAGELFLRSAKQSDRMPIASRLSEIKLVLKEFNRKNVFDVGMRQEPASLLMMGAPGVGKSIAMQHIINAILPKIMTEEEKIQYKETPAYYVYNRKAEQGFWDGYNSNVKVVVFDDFGQAKGADAGGDSEWMNVIRCINSFENILHSASIEEKGNILFRSPFVLANTNLFDFNIDELADPGAFMRRWDLPVIATPKPEYAKPGGTIYNSVFDDSKLPKDSNGRSIKDPRYCLYHVVKPLTRTHRFEVTGEVLDFDGLVMRLAYNYDKKEQYHVANTNAFQQTFEDFEKRWSLINQITEPQMDFMEEFEDAPEQPYVDVTFGDSDFRPKTMIDLLEAGMYDRIAYVPLQLTLKEAIDKNIADKNDLNPVLYRSLMRKVRNLFYKVSDWLVHPYALDYCYLAVSTGICFDEEDYAPLLQYINTREDEKPVDMLRYIMAMDKKDYGIDLKDSDNFLQAGLKSIFNFFVRIFNIPSMIVYYLCATKVSVTTLSRVREISHIFTLMSLTGLAVSAAVTFLTTIFKFLKNAVKRVVGQGNNYNRHQGPKIRRDVGKTRITIPQALKDNKSLHDVAGTVIDRNLFRLVTQINDDDEYVPGDFRQMGYGLGIKDRIVLVPYHYGSILQYLSEIGHSNRICYITRATENRTDYPITIDTLLSCFKQTQELKDMDLAYFDLPKDSFQPVRDITKFFVTEAYLKKTLKFKSVLFLPQEKMVEAISVVSSIKNSLLVAGDKEHENYTIKRVAEYDAFTSRGDCGSPLMLDGVSGCQLIVGLHVAGTLRNGLMARSYGYSAIVTKDMLDKLLLNRLSDFPDSDIDNYVSDVTMKLPVVFEGNISSFGKLKVSPGNNTQTELRKSVLYGKIAKPIMEPAKLKPFKVNGVKVDPMEKAKAKYCATSLNVDLEVLDEAVLGTADDLFRFSTKRTVPKIYSYKEAICGDENEPNFGSITRGTSAGFPYNTYSGIKSKKRFWGGELEYDLDSVNALELQRRVEEIEAKASKGQRSLLPFTDALKDEKRNVDKVQQGKTRMFSAAPTEYTILVRKYFGDFQAWCINNNIINEIALGVNPHGMAWHIMTEKLLFGTPLGHIGAGDFSAFDASHNSYIQSKILTIIERYYYNSTEEEREVRRILFLEITNSFHVNRGELEVWRGAMASGNPLTTLLNCIYNKIAFRYCFIKILNQPVSDFVSLVHLMVMGDDNVFGVHSSIASVFTEQAIAPVMAELGLKYTPEDKTLLDWGDNLRPITEVSFLKRAFRRHSIDNLWVAPLDIEVLIESLNWCRKGSSTFGDMEQVIEGVMYELCLHDKSTFAMWRNNIVSVVDSIEDLEVICSTDYGVLYRTLRRREQ